MEDGGPTASIILFLILMVINAMIYGFGAAVQELNLKEEQRKAVENSNKKASRICRIMGGSEKYVNMVQLIITFINLFVGACYLRVILVYAEHFTESLAGQWGHISEISVHILVWVSFIVVTLLLLYVILVFGMLIPKKMAKRSPEKWAYRLINPIYTLMCLFAPFTKFMSVTAGAILKLLGLHTDQDNSDVTEEEILSMVNEGHEQGVIQASEAKMINNIFEFGDKEAQDIMTNRRDIVAIDGSTSFGEAIRFMLKERNSRYPVYEENIDHIIGILHMKDALRMHPNVSENMTIAKVPGLLREARFIPETRKIDVLFKTMQSTKQQMVIVVDEYGQTSGLIAMEDILEEIVGNILDEYDEDIDYIEEKGKDVYIIEGKTHLEDLEERFHISFHEEEFETLNGFFISKLQRIPEPDEQFSVDVDGYNFKILSVQNKMIQSVMVTKLPETKQTVPDSDESEKAAEE